MSKRVRRFRMVVQQLGLGDQYRLVVYGDAEKPRHSDFNGREALMEVLESVLSSADIANLCFDPLHAGQGTIVFAGEVTMEDRHLQSLRLI